MPKRKRPEQKPKEQFKAFVQTVKSLGIDEGDAVLDREFKKLSPQGNEDKKATPIAPTESDES